MQVKSHQNFIISFKRYKMTVKLVPKFCNAYSEFLYLPQMDDKYFAD